MKVSECILKRRSIRNFKNKPIPNDDIIKILEAARWAPSAKNRQVIRFIVVTYEEILEDISNHAKILFFKQRHAAKAPVIIAVCTPKGTWIEEIGAAIQNMLLLAWTLGIGSCWIGSFNKNKVKEILKIPKKYKIYQSDPRKPLPLGSG
ncbi:MAG: NADH dehydrogenase FAD-containing subunit [Candidatus Lokiarchaeota archaeon]|nr:NADH dehydrogenase FAD-containing subunit [Candidatus Lokiarchaeota archaeon]